MGGEPGRTARYASAGAVHGTSSGPCAEPYGQGPPPFLPGGGARFADDVACQIKGFTPQDAVAPGETVDFRVTVNPPRDFTIDVYRVGDFGGRGARLLARSPRLPGLCQPAPLIAGRTVSCHHWWLSWRLRIPAHWRPGAHVAVLTTADGAYQSLVPFTVRDDRPADLLLVLPDVSWQADNAFPGDGRRGASLRHAWDDDGRLLGEADAAVTLCFDRPYTGSGLPPDAARAYDVIRWAERCGYDLAYATARDLHAGRVEAGRYRALVFPGRDAYWSVPMRRAVERARDGGTSLVFLAAAALTWRVTLGALPSGDPDRVLTCRRRKGPGRPALWREHGAPEQLVLGIQHGGPVPSPAPLVVRNAGHWLWEATGAREGDELPGLVAGEADRYFPRTPLPPHDSRVLLAHSPYRDAAGTRRYQETSLYQAPSGAWVFAAGTLAWTAALARPGHVHPVVRRATANLFDRICKRD